jgi:hypothetical protein
MPRTCIGCRHPQRVAIDTALTLKTPLRTISGQFQISKSALLRHRQHMASYQDSAIYGVPEAPAEVQALPQHDATGTPWRPLSTEATQALAQALHDKASRATCRIYTDATERAYYVLGQTAVPDPAWHALDAIVAWLLARWRREGRATCSKHTTVPGLYWIHL